MKLGRNDKCHCGSGKKYKKCCLGKAVTIEKLEAQENAMANSEFGMGDEDEWEYDDIYDDIYEETEGSDVVEYLPKIDEKYLQQSIEINKEKSYYEENGYHREFPTISDAEEAKIDAWYNEHKKISSANELKEHLDGFLNENSIDVITNMSLNESVLFDLIDKHVRKKKTELIIDYLIEFRTKYPDVYIRSFSYLDIKIIAWLIFKNRSDEVPQFLNYFELYPIHDADKLFELIDLLLATNNSALALSLVTKVYKEICYSKKISGGYEIADNLVAQIVSPFINENYTKDNARSIVSELEMLVLNLNKEYFEEDYWDNRLKTIMKDYTKWEEIPPKNKKDFEDKVFEILLNFSGFLIERTKIDYISASFCTKMLGQYYRVITTGKKPKNMFLFSEAEIEEAIATISQYFLWVDLPAAFTVLNGLYYFAEYLFECGNYDENQKVDVQNLTIKIAKVFIKNSNNQSVQSFCFKTFPSF